MQQFIENSTSYVVAIFSIMFAMLIDNTSGIMAVGGLILLVLRLYIEIKNVRRINERNRDE